MKIRTKKISLLAAVLLMCASLCMTCLTAAFAEGSYLFNGDTGSLTGYNGKTATALASDESKPEDSLTGGSFVYSNTAGAGATYSWVGSTAFDANETYNAVRFVVYVDDPMLSWTLQFGVFAGADAISDGACKFDNLMDSSGIRWEKSSGRESGLTAGWNVVTLPFNDVETYDGFARNNYMLNTKNAVNGFAVRAHSGSTPFTLKIYSVEMVKLSDKVCPGIKKYGQKALYEYDSYALELGDYHSGTGALTVAQMEISEGKTVTAYQANGWGGYYNLYPITKTDATELANSGYGAISFRMYFRDEDSLAAYRLATGFNLDLCCSEDYSDSCKYSWNIAGLGLFDKCSVGWNEIIVPFDSAAEKNNMDWSALRWLRINAMGGPNVATWTATADFELIASDVKEPTVVGWVDPGEDPDVPQENLRIECKNTGLHLEGCDSAWSDGSIETGTGFYKAGTGALKLVGAGTLGCNKKLESSFDLSEYESISFWLYTDNAASFLAMTDGQLEMTSSGGKNDANEYHWALKDLTLKDGWNYVTLPFASAEKSGEVDIAEIDWIGMYFIGLPQSCTVIFDDFHAHKAASGTVIESFDGGFATFVETVSGKVDSATNMSGQGFVARVKKAEAIDIADYDLITLWVYCADETAAASVSGTEMELSSSGQCDKNELTFHFPSLSVGWNYLKFNIADAVHTGGDADLTKINFVGFVKQGIPQVTVYFDDLRAIESSTISEATAPIEKKVILDCDKQTVGVFDGLTVDDIEYQQGYSALTTSGTNGSEVLSAAFGPIDTGLELSGEHELGYGFWFYIDSVSKLSSVSVELSSSSSPDHFELEWAVDLSTLTDGWNWLTFKASEASRVGGVIDLSAVCRTRLIVFGNEALTVKLDAFVLADATAEGALDPITDKIVLDPVDSVVADNCETEWVGGKLNDTEKKQGFSSIELSKEQNATDSVSASTGINVGKTDLLITNVKSNNELGVTLWVYVENMAAINGVTVRLTDSNMSTNHIAWTVPDLTNGWNWVTLAVSKATVTGVVDADALTELEVIVNAAIADEGYQAFRVLIDRVSIVNYTVAASLAQPEDEGTTRNPIQELIFIDCNSVGGTVFTGNRVDKEDFCYGTGSVYTSGAGYQLTATDLEIGKTDLTKETLVLAFWIWIEDVDLYKDGDVNAQVELTSSNTYDQNEIHWDFKKLTENFRNGWNWVVLYGKDGEIEGGSPDYDGLNYFRLYVNNISQSTLKIDRVTLGYIGNTALATAPNVEDEKINTDGQFKGANAYPSENGPYLEVDFDEAEGFTVHETITENGCEDEPNTASLSLIGLLFAVAAVFKFRK